MKILEKNIGKNSFKYVQIERDVHKAIYAQYMKDIEKPIRYEVFKVRIVKECTMPNGKVIEEHECFPGDDKFGKFAWTYATYEEAKLKYDKL